jgi:REP element-mobilizing transposase RayT
MGRQRRDLSTSEWFHLVNRGSDRQDLFSIEGDWVLWEQLVAEAFARFEVELHAYAWMANHVHMLARTERGDISAAMQRACARYALAYNERTGREGPLFTGRFRSKPVTNDAQLAQTARYIHRNPLAIVPAAALARYRWSSLGPLVGARSAPEWLSTGTVDVSGDYLAYVLEPQPGDRAGDGATAPPVSCDDIDQVVSTLSGSEINRLRDGLDRRHVEPRTLAIMLAVELRVATSSELAQHYGLSDSRSIRRAARRGRVRTADSPSFAVLRLRTLRELGRAA